MAENNHVNAARPEVLPLVVEFERHHRGCYAEFHGTREQLVSAGLVDTEWLEESAFGSSGVRSRRNQFGNEVTVHKRARGRFELRVFTKADDDQDLNDKRRRKLKWFREHGEELDRTVANVIARVSQPREAQS